MAAPSYQSWQAPPQAASENTKLGWLNEHAEDAQSWQRSQRGYGDWQKAFEILSGRANAGQTTSYRSQLSTARLKRNIKEIRGCLTDIRPIWGYTSNNKALQDQAEMMNKVTIAIYQKQFMDLSIKRAFDWAATTCTGWVHPVFRRRMGGRGKGDVFLPAYGQPSVLASQLPSDGNYQEAYAVSLMDEMPIWMAHGLFPEFQNQLKPTTSRYWYSSDIRRAATGNLWQRMFGSLTRGVENPALAAYVPVRKTWVIDLSINETGETLYMGDWGVDSRGKKYPVTSWSYAVPSYKSMMENGKKASENDSKIYPNRRLMLSSETVMMYDGPSFDWHGELPLIPLCLDDWSFEPMGYSLVRDGYQIQQSLDELERGTMDKNRAQMDMSLAYDINSVTRKEAHQYDPMEPRGRVGYDGSTVDEPFKSVVPPEILMVRPEIFTAIEHLEQTMDYQMGIKDITSLAKARGLMGSEDLDDKLGEASGPIVKELTRNVERFLSGIGNQVKYMIPQWYPTQVIMQYVGPDKITKSTIDYDPAKLIPSHLPDEKVHDDKTQKPLDSKYSFLERARWFCDNLDFSIVPHTAHELTQMAQKLGLVQLRKAGIQISSRTIAEAWNISNFGGPDAPTEYDRFFREQEDVAKHAIRLKQMAEAISNAGIEAPPSVQNAIGLLSGQNANEGRPTVGLQAPKMIQKDGDTRTTISQSGS